MKSPLEETESSKFNDFLLAGFQSPIGYAAATGQGGISSSSCLGSSFTSGLLEMQSTSLPVGVGSVHWETSVLSLAS